MSLWEKIFGRKEKKKQEAKEPQEMPIVMPKLKGESLEIYNILLNGIDKMKKKGITRLYLLSEEIQPDERAFGGWINMGDMAYYPYEMLDPREQELILAKKHYSIGALVSGEIPINKKGGLKKVTYPDYGFEVFERTHCYPMLCEMKDTPEVINDMEYYRQNCFYNPEQMKLIAEQLTKAKATAKEVEEMINQGIKNYHQITRNLMEEAGVLKSLKNLEKRTEANPAEEILSMVRKQINLANYTG